MCWWWYQHGAEYQCKGAQMSPKAPHTEVDHAWFLLVALNYEQNKKNVYSTKDKSTNSFEKCVVWPKFQEFIKRRNLIIIQFLKDQII